MSFRTISRFLAFGIIVVAALSMGSCDIVSVPGGDLNISNASGTDIWYLYVAEQSNPTWGSERLGATTILFDGNSFMLENLEPGIYDLYALDENENDVDEYYGIEIVSGETAFYTIY